MRTLKTFYFAVGFSMQCFVNTQAQTNDELSAKLISPVAENHWTIYFKDPKEGETPVVWHADRKTNLKKSIPTPFGQHSTGQNIEQLEKELGIEGKILNILDAMNAIHVKVSEEEILKLKNRSDVEAVEPVMISFLDSTQSNPKWALDRIDEPYPDTPDNTYNFSYSGSGQTVYVLDSGLDVGDSFITAEFGSRASLLYDFNGSTGEDTIGHGTAVASLVAGNTFGVAKDASILMVKVTDGGTISEYPLAITDSLNWLAANAPAGTIVNISFGHASTCSAWQAQDNNKKNAIIAAANAGILVFVSAGNAGCLVDDINWESIPEAFAVGGLQYYPFYYLAPDDEDRVWTYSNYGETIDSWAPAEFIQMLSDDDISYCDPTNCGSNGTSFASPILAGIAAVACEAYSPDCSTIDVLNLYDAFKASGNSTVLKQNGDPLPTGHPDIVIWQQW